MQDTPDFYTSSHGIVAAHRYKKHVVRLIELLIGYIHACPNFLVDHVCYPAGFAGHANYCVANAAVDSMATSWTTQGHPAIAIQWGAWSSVGEHQASLRYMSCRVEPALWEPVCAGNGQTCLTDALQGRDCMAWGGRSLSAAWNCNLLLQSLEHREQLTCPSDGNHHEHGCWFNLSDHVSIEERIAAGMAAAKQLTAAKADAMGFLSPHIGLGAMARLLQGVRLGSPLALCGSAGVAQSSYWRQLLQGMTSPPPFFADLPPVAAIGSDPAPELQVRQCW